MSKRLTTLMGLGLVLLGGLAFFDATILNWLGFGLWRLWPLTVSVLGLALVTAPFLSGNPRKLAPLFIPGLPILMASALLMWGSVFNWWNIWEYAWPTILLAFALGFGLTAVFMRISWFLIPGIILGLIGLAFQFTASTGWWEMWAVLWPVNILAVGLALFITGQIECVAGLKVAGTILIGLSGAAFALMTVVMSGVLGVLGAVLLIGSGGILLLRGLVGQRPLPIEEKELKEKLPESVA